MKPLGENQQKFLEKSFEGPHNFVPSEGGHMAYNRLLFEDQNGQSYFVKAHDRTQFDEPWREKEMWNFLRKEQRMYEHLDKSGFVYTPESSLFSEDLLVLSGLVKSEGWLWRAPKEAVELRHYVNDVFSAFTHLEYVTPPSHEPEDEISIDVFYNHGWDKLHDQDVPKIISSNLARWSGVFKQHDIVSARRMVENLDSLFVKRADLNSSVFNHHDARQANIAWHPEYGAKIVDWSWADAGLLNGDFTMFILDLHKSGHEVTEYLDSINVDYAKMVLGYWLQRSQTRHAEGNEVVRMQQFVSAIKAAELLLSV